MKLFLSKLLSFALIVVVLTLCINQAYIVNNKADSDGTKKYEEMPVKIDICNFGSSHGQMSFDYEDVTAKSCFNFALSSQSLSYDARIIDYYKDHLNKGATVFIVISYFSLFGNGETYESGFTEKNKRYYRILPSEMIKEYDLKTDIYVNYFPSLAANVNLLKVLMGRSGDENDTGEAQWEKEIEEGADLSEDAIAAYKRHIAINKFDEEGNRIVNKEEIDALCHMINVCQEMEAVPIMITTPFLHEYTEVIKEKDSEFFEDYYGLVYEIADRYNIDYYDYGMSVQFSNNRDYFMNVDHLNKKGAKFFTEQVLKRKEESLKCMREKKY